MNIARGNDVLRMIDDSVCAMESETERLAMLLAECRRNEYWRLRNFKSEQAWIWATFTDKTLMGIQWLAKLGECYANDPGIITEIGPAKAALIKDLHNRKSWVSKAKDLSLSALQDEIKRKTSRIRTPFQARERINRLEKRIARLQDEIRLTQNEIDFLRKRWEDANPEEYSLSVCPETIRRWEQHQHLRHAEV